MSSSSSNSTASSLSRFRQQSILKPTIKTDAGEADKLDMTNHTFNLANSIYIKDMVEKLHPKYKLPERIKLGGKMLDQVYNKVKAKNNKAIDASETLVILKDGWSKSQNNAP